MNAIVRRLSVAGVAVALCAACGGGAEDGSQTAETAAEQPSPVTDTSPSAGYTVVDVADGGRIQGVVRFRGAPPPPRTIAVEDNAEACGVSQAVQPVKIGTDAGLANVVVSLVDITRGVALAAETPLTLDQRGCRFIPHVLLAPVGQAVHVLNSDPLTHNVHTAAFDNRSVNRTQPASAGAMELTFDMPEKVGVRCDIHPWMDAWIAVIDHPYHAITNEAGAFALDDIPPGTYTLEFWHETLGSRTQSVSVSAGQSTNANIELTQQ